MADGGEHPNAQRLRQGYEAFAKADLPAVQELFADDVVWHIGGRGKFAGDHRGKDAVLGLLGDLMSHTGGTLKLEVHDVLANDEHAIGLIHQTGQAGGKTLSDNMVQVYHVGGDGKVTEGWFFPGDTYAEDEFFS